MTLDTYAGVFDNDPTAVADRLDQRVGELRARTDCGRRQSLKSTMANAFALAMLAPPDGLEPSTVRLTVGSSAN
jgi:hypothetical protein